MGDIFLLNRANAFLDTLTKGKTTVSNWASTVAVNDKINENIYNAKSGDHINANWISNNIINIITKKRFDKDLSSKKSDTDDDAKRKKIIQAIVDGYKTSGLYNMYLSGEYYSLFCKEKDGKSTTDSKCFTYPEANDDSSSLGSGIKTLLTKSEENTL